MSHLIFKRLFHSPDETTKFSHRFAAILRPGDVVLLSGGIGAGKTHFARGVIQSLLIEPEDVPSPTFTLVQTYETENGMCWHADLYRVGGPGEVAELGLLDAFEEAICLIEWPDRLGPDQPQDALNLEFVVGVADETRTISATSNSPVWSEKLSGFGHD